MSGWSRRRASRARRARRGATALALPVLLAVALGTWSPPAARALPTLVVPWRWLPSAGPTVAATAGFGGIALADSAGASGAQRRALAEDRAWLRTRPQLSAPPPPATEPAAVADWVRRRLAGGGQGDAGAGQRSLPSLLRDRWLARGYLGATVERRTGGDGLWRLVVVPGPVYRLGAVRVGGPDFPGREALLARTVPRPGSRVEAAGWRRAVADLLAGAGELGHPFPRWLVREVRVDPEAATLSLDAMLLVGESAVLGGQTSDLPPGPGRRFLSRASGLREGESFRETDLERARARLLARDVWAEVGDPVVYLLGADTVGVHWPVVPRERPNRLAVVAGLSRRLEGQEQVSRLSGQVDLLLPNIAGTGRRLAARWSDDGRDRSYLAFGYLEPLAFGTPLDAEASIAHEVARGSYTRFSLDGRLRLPVVAEWGLELGLGWDRGTYPVGGWESSRRLRARAALLRRRLDPARSGWEGVFAIESARRTVVARRDTAADAEPVAAPPQERQTLLEFDLGGELWLGPVWSLAGRGSYREIESGGGPVPASELYRIGGARSVRGYRQDEFAGERTAAGALELRAGRPGGSRVYAFWDVGYFRLTAPAPPGVEARRRVEDVLHGFGLGLMTRTPGGDIDLAVGFPGTLDFEGAKLHVALLEAF